MTRKIEIKKIRPSEAINSLELYNEKVVMLVQQCRMALQHNLVDKAIAESMKNAMDEVNSFFEIE